MKWPQVPIGDLCVPTETKDPRDKPEQPFLYLDIASIDRQLKTITAFSEILGAEAPSRARKVIRANDVLVSTVRPNLNAVAIVPRELDGQIASTGFCVLRPQPGVLHHKFLFYFAVTPQFVDGLSSRVRGAHYPAVSEGDVKKLTIPLPPLSEQRRIVEILDQADALRKKRAEADAKAARILSAIFYKMFGDPATNPKGWPMHALGDLCLGRPEYGANARAAPWTEGRPRYVRITDISDAGDLSSAEILSVELEDWSRYRLQEGDVLFARSGNTVGKTFLYRITHGTCVYAGYLIRFRTDRNRLLPQYLFAITQTDWYRSWVETKMRVAGQPNINGQEYAALRIPRPPVELQQRFAQMAEEAWRIQGILRNVRSTIDAMFEGLLHHAFSGDLTTRWREAHMKELLAEMEAQAKILEAVR